MPAPEFTEELTSIKNPKLVHIRTLLSDKKYRTECHEFIVEGDKFINELKLEDISYIVTSTPFKLKESFQKLAFTAQDELMQRVSGTENAQSMIAVVKMPKHSLSDISKGKYIIAEGIQDPGNLGTIIRTIEAAGAKGLIYTQGTVDPFSPKVVRASAGSILRVPVIAAKDTQEIKLAQPSMQLIATVMHKGTSFKNVTYAPLCGIVLGSEGQGISDTTARLAEMTISIPLQGKAESLNVGITAGIILFNT